MLKEQITAKKLSADAKVLPLLALPTKPADERWADITVAHLLDHEGGWDATKTFDPMFRPAQAMGGDLAARLGDAAGHDRLHADAEAANSIRG